MLAQRRRPRHPAIANAAAVRSHRPLRRWGSAAWPHRRRLAGALFLLAGAASPVSGQETAAAVRDAELARFAAQVQRDTAALHRMLDDELVYVHSNALVERKADFIESVATGTIQYDSIRPLDMRHRRYGDVAVGNGAVFVQVRLDGTTHRVELLFTTVHVRRGGRWRLVAWQSTRAR